jgi:multiple sugar transport system permease protein
MILLSLKQYPDRASNIISVLTSEYSLSNYPSVLLSDDFVLYFINSIIVATSVTLSNILFCSMTGYVLARKNFFGKKIIIASVLSLIIIPSYVVMIPLYKIMIALN